MDNPTVLSMKHIITRITSQQETLENPVLDPSDVPVHRARRNGA